MDLYLPILILGAIAAAFAIGSVGIALAIGPRRYNRAKLEAYECGIEPAAQRAGAGRLRAALDVTDPEPLPPEHPLWRCPGVLITPHLGGDSEAFVPRARRMVDRQLQLLAAGAFD